MGLDINAARFLLGEKSRGIRFGKILNLGRQGVYMGKKPYVGFMNALGMKSYSTDYADDFFIGLGADQMKSMDASAYENADIIHDINEPVNIDLHSAFDTLIDGGTLEHVFNFPIAIKNCMKMVKPGGQLILMTPWHNYAGHGFYQFSPELIYNTLSPANGYQVERMLIVAEGSWYSVKKPEELKHRVEIHSNDSILLYVTARRISECEIFSQWPQQSDYNAAWQSEKLNAPTQFPKPSLINRLTDHFPAMENSCRVWREHKARKSLSPSRNKGLIRLCPRSEIP